MRSRFPILTTLACTVLAVVATTATGSTERRSTIPSCEQLLPLFEAEMALGEPKAAIIGRAVLGGTTRACAYAGFSKGAIGHSLELEWGPYGDRRKMIAPFAKTYICPVSKAACSKLQTAATLKPNLKSFAGIEKALRQVGVTKWLSDPAFDRNPTFVWRPARQLAPMDQMSFVAVYVVKSGKVLEVGCTDNVAKEADTGCARKAAAWSYDSVP